MQTAAAVDLSSLTGGDHVQATVTNYYNFAFQTSSTTLCDLTNPLALCVLCALLLLVRVLKKIFRPKFSAMGKRLGRTTHGPEWEHNNEDRIEKFGEYVYKLIYHSSVSVYGLWYFHDKSWWNKEMGGTIDLWKLHPNHPVDPGMAWYYLVQGAYHVDSLLSLLEISIQIHWVNPLTYPSAYCFSRKECFVVNGSCCKKSAFNIETTQVIAWTPVLLIKWSPNLRGDFTEMAIHHIITNLLIIGSSHFRFTRIGSMIFLVHDLSELPVELSKLSNFVKWKVATGICFSIMLVTWIVSRVWIFPIVIFKSLLVESHEYLVVRGTMDPAFYNMHVVPFGYLLGGLIALHVMWLFILLRIGWTFVRKGEAHDYSEYKDGEDQAGKKQN
jgi:hypothetical protein